MSFSDAAPSAANKKQKSVSFIKYYSQKSGLSERTIREYLQIGENITEEVKALIAQTELARKTKELLKLSKLPPNTQLQVVKKILEGGAKTIDEALAIRHNKLIEEGRKWQTQIHKAYKDNKFKCSYLDLIKILKKVDELTKELEKITICE